MSDLLSNGMAGGFSVVKESLTTQDLSRMATLRNSRRTETVYAVRLTPSNSMGLKSPSEVSV